MSEPEGFTPMAPAGLPEIGVGMVGYGFMGKAHTNAYKKMRYFFWPPPAMPRLIAMAGRNQARVAEQARRYGYEGYYTDWRKMLRDDRVRLLDNCTPPYMHAEVCVAAAEAGKHLLCEKPLAPTVPEAYHMFDAAEKAGVKHMTGYCYRFVPAVRLARQLLDQGVLGEVRLFRGRYLQEGWFDANRPMRALRPDERAGEGALNVIGCHLVDMARFLVGEFTAVTGRTTTFIKERPVAVGSSEWASVEYDDAVHALVEFEGGAVGTIEAANICPGRKNQHTWEINGSKGSMWFDLERLNELQVYLVDQRVPEVVGFQDVMVTEPNHPYARVYWPRAHTLGWEDAFVNQAHHLIDAITNDRPVAPLGATFEDGYRVAVISAAIQESGRTGRRIKLSY